MARPPSINKVVEGLTKPKTASSTDVTVDIGGGVTAVIPVDLLVDRLLANKKFQQAAGITAPTTQEDTIDYNGAAISRVEANLGARIDALKSNKSLADQAFYISRPTDTQMATFFVTGTPSFGGGPDPASKLPPARHPNAVALKPDVVIYNDFTIDELMRDLYWMLYDGGGKDGKPVKLSPASVIYNGQTIQDWAAYMYVTRVLAERACVAAGVSPVA